ncbi:unnamed protein product [Lactuca saligna]|uniref:Uncharacterized protein n=1 Tax=Lactuca saligna TaxID=75948 RepID=A0AA35Y033_LACSI|nr:unnamed protein product [Lactuca saligna]
MQRASTCSKSFPSSSGVAPPSRSHLASHCLPSPRSLPSRHRVATISPANKSSPSPIDISISCHSITAIHHKQDVGLERE